MCGIVGYIGPRNAVSVVVQGLRDLDYRGYEAAGVAGVQQGEFIIQRFVEEGKGSARVDPGDLLEQWQKKSELNVRTCIGHTRWPTHGENTVENAHPHVSQHGRIAVVHNGVIDNFIELRKELEKVGVLFQSETDTEVIAHMVERELDQHDLLTAVNHVVSRLQGSYAILICDRDTPDVIVAAVLGSPLLVGMCDGEVIVASDLVANVRYTKTMIDLEDGDVVVIRQSGIEDSQHVARTVDVDLYEIDTQGFDHHMMKEIMEQPRTIRSAMSFGGRLDIDRGIPRFGGFRHYEDRVADVDHVVLVACGTAYHAAMIGARYLRDLAGMTHVEVMVASEADLTHMRSSRSMLIAISQSGETFDTKRVVEEAKLKNILTFGVVNRPGSWISRATDCGVHCQAGAEISVASTKVFVSQLSVLYLLAVFMGRQRRLRLHEGVTLLQDLVALPDVLQDYIEDDLMDACEMIVSQSLSKVEFVAFLGRGAMYPIALEGALKFKEITYVCAEGYPAGELKHGPLALLDENRMVVVLIPDDYRTKDMMTSLSEAVRTGVQSIVIADEGLREQYDSYFKDLKSHVVYVPHVPKYLKPFVYVSVLQMLSYFTALKLGRSIDKPRNLAKSVTVA